MRAVRLLSTVTTLAAAGCAGAPPGGRAAGAAAHAPVEHFIEIETDAGRVVGMSCAPAASGILWRAADGSGEVSELASPAAAGEPWHAVFRVVAMPAGREAYLHLPLRTRAGEPVDILVHGAPFEPAFGAADARILLGRDEATRIAVRRRAR